MGRLSAPSLGLAGNSGGSEDFLVPGNLESIFEIHQQLSALSRQMGQRSARLADSERQRAREVDNATAVRAASQAEEKR